MSNVKIKPGSKLFETEISFTAYVMAESEEEAESIARRFDDDILGDIGSDGIEVSAIERSPTRQLNALIKSFGEQDTERLMKFKESLGFSKEDLDSLVYHRNGFDVTVKELIDFVYAAELEEAKDDKPAGES